RLAHAPRLTSGDRTGDIPPPPA
ncbi:uncharacterized protein METZ01_LOCUS472568, partial [marine metagenome]